MRILQEPVLAFDAWSCLALLTSVILTLFAPKSFCIVAIYLITFLSWDFRIACVTPNGLLLIIRISAEVRDQATLWICVGIELLMLVWDLSWPLLAWDSASSFGLRASVILVLIQTCHSFLAWWFIFFVDWITIVESLVLTGGEAPNCFARSLCVSAAISNQSFFRVFLGKENMALRSLACPFLALVTLSCSVLRSSISTTFVTPQSLWVLSIQFTTVLPSDVGVCCVAPNIFLLSIWISAEVGPQIWVWVLFWCVCMFMGHMGGPALASCSTNCFWLTTPIALTFIIECQSFKFLICRLLFVERIMDRTAVLPSYGWVSCVTPDGVCNAIWISAVVVL